MPGVPGSRVRRIALAAACAAGIAAATTGAVAANAATLTVTTTADSLAGGDGQCSLREAIIAVDSPGANSDCGAAGATQNTIELGPHTYTLSIAPTGGDDATTGDLNLTSAVGGLTITGAGVDRTTISASGLGDRILNAASGASATVTGLSLTGGHAPTGATGTFGNFGAPTPGGPGGSGGAILNAGTLTLDDLTITGNAAGNGGQGGGGGSFGATGQAGGSGGAGGGIANSSSGRLTLSSVTITANRSGTGGAGGYGFGSTGGSAGPGGAGGNGGAVNSGGAALTIDHSTIAQNIAGNGGAGGAGGAGTSPTGVGGSGGAGGSGGGIASTGSALNATSDTITGNLAGSGGAGGAGGIPGPPPDGPGGAAGNAGVGGGVIIINAGTAPAPALTFVTLSANQLGSAGTPGIGGAGGNTPGAAGQGATGGGMDTIGANPVVVTTSILAANAINNCAGTAPSDGLRNLSFGAGCPAGFGAGDPKLGSLRDNGGPTQTEALGAGSAAIGYGPHTGQCFGTDQRGIPRSNLGCDVGAYQVTPPAASAPVVSATSETTATVSAAVTANQTSASAQFVVDPAPAGGAGTAIQTVPGFQQPATITASLSGLVPATLYHVHLVATSSDGTTQSTDTTFSTASVPSPPRSEPPPSAAPVLGRVGLRPSAFLAAPQRHHRTGTTISYTDSLAARTTLTVQKIAAGIRRGRRCVAPPRHTQAKRCPRLITVGSVTHRDGMGSNRVSFNGRLRGLKLAPGRYRLQIVPRLSGRTGKLHTLDFRILAPPRPRR